MNTGGMCLQVIFHNTNIWGSWGDVNKVLNKCLNDWLYTCEGSVHILHDMCGIQKCIDVWTHNKAFRYGGDACRISQG